MKRTVSVLVAVGVCGAAAGQTGFIRHYFYIPLHMSAFEWHVETAPVPMVRTFTLHAERLSGGVTATADGATTTSIDVGSVVARSWVTVVRPANGIGAPSPYISSDWEPWHPEYARYSVSDVVFADTANPASTATVQVWVHAKFRGEVVMTGAEGCGLNTRSARLGYSLGIGSTGGGAYTIDDLSVSNGLPPGVQVDGTPYGVTTGPYTVTLGTPVTLVMAAASEVSAGICYPPATAMDPGVDATAEIFLAPGDAVFTTPAGIVASSAQGLIADNVFLGTGLVCDPTDFNGDGLFPDTADIDDFLSVFSGGPCSTGTCGDTDFNNDGLFPDTADIDALLSVFSGGPCL
ncbi:MAG TPA: hypothetical protein VHN77_08370 [Phycisphaerales bacterium]|nr:hypothetical protein [Phycisphaerales bacterium]